MSKNFLQETLSMHKWHTVQVTNHKIAQSYKKIMQ